MGFNTGVLILNDSMDGITEKPEEFAANFMAAFHAFNDLSNHGKPQFFRVGNCVNGGTIFHMAHADVTSAYAIGGNCTSKLATGYNGGKHHTDADKLDLLKQIAAELGYTVSKKRKKKQVKEVS